ncbi:putative reverse transcriptase-RNaseH-integrase [Puccinia sorghi]|uniref:Putative reverse transcriptase-RNaseH-integrase n=1 Tax=Puccinia sorghi TaxID=27349 RepID=A0A0L6VPU9_9BASI|nr:putative reverse transcriptase-RNaseH-integrase [Puccinia sorghi]
MTRDVKDYVNSCYDCNRNKSSKHRKYGLIQPLPWHSLSMDLSPKFLCQMDMMPSWSSMAFLITLLAIVVHYLTESLHSLSSRVQQTN